MHDDFWTDFASGRWEPETFCLFDHCISSETVFLDVGCWIGPTLLYAATRAKLSLGFEPDPLAYRELVANVGLNPHLRSVRVFPFAISPRHGGGRMGSSTTPGDSMSSLLFARCGVAWTIEMRRLEDFEHEWPAGAPVFLKIDIEGGEYALLPHLRDFVRRQQPTVYLSLHPQFFMAQYFGRSRMRRLPVELALFCHFCRILSVFRSYACVYDAAGGRLRGLDLLKRRTWRRPRALVLANETIPFLEA